MQTFRIGVYHKRGKENLIADALSRLPRKGDKKRIKRSDEFDLDTICVSSYCAQAASILELSLLDEFKRKIKRAYRSDTRYQRITDVLKSFNQDSIEIPYKLQDGLLLMEKDKTLSEYWICVPRSLHRDVVPYDTR